MKESAKTYAIISDIHGNITALNAVLKDIRENKIDSVICLGDIIGKGPRSKEAVDICRAECDVVLQGNWDDLVSRIANELDTNPWNAFMSWYARQLDKTDLDYLSSLPGCHEIVIGGKTLRLFHASAESIHKRVYHNDTEENHHSMFKNTEFTGNSMPADIVGYGDIHFAFKKKIGDRILFNTGSVGNSLDCPGASYVTIKPDDNDSVSLCFKRIYYDIEKELREGEKYDMPYFREYASELRTASYCKRK